MSRLYSLLFVFALIPYALLKCRIRTQPLKKTTYKVAIPNCWPIKSFRGVFHNALFLIDGEHLCREDIAVLLVRKGPADLKRIKEYSKEYKEASVTMIDPNKLSFPVKPLLFDLMPRLALLGVRITFCFGSGHMEKICIRSVFNIVRISLEWETILHNYQIENLLNNEEHSFPHAVETLVFERFGGRNIRIPHSQILPDRGVMPSYLHYSLFLSGGTYLGWSHGKTWSHTTKIEQVGIPTNDHLKYGDEEIADNPTLALVQLMKKKFKLVAIFPGGYDSNRYSKSRYIALLDLCEKILIEFPDVAIVFKPKGSHIISFLMDTVEGRKIFGRLKSSKRFVIVHPNFGHNSTLQFLAKHSIACISQAGDQNTIGSAWVECALIGKPSFAYNPTPKLDRTDLTALFENSLIFGDHESLIECLGDVLEEKWENEKIQLLRPLFDPFCDSQAIDRIRSIVLRGSEPQSNSPRLPGKPCL